MIPLGKHRAIFFRTILKSPLSAKTLLHCSRILRGVATGYRIQTERPRLRAFVISVKPCTLLHFFVIHKQYMIRTLTCEQHVRIPIVTIIITDVRCVCKSHAVTLSMYCYHFVTIGASGKNI